MIRTAAALCALALAGCAYNVRLLEDGRTHLGSFNLAQRSMEVTIDGDKYQGPLSRGASTGFFTGTAGTRFYSGTVIAVSSQFQSLLTNSAGRILRCQFEAPAGTGQGVCQMNDGRMFDVLVSF